MGSEWLTQGRPPTCGDLAIPVRGFSEAEEQEERKRETGERAYSSLNAKPLAPYVDRRQGLACAQVTGERCQEASDGARYEIENDVSVVSQRVYLNRTIGITSNVMNMSPEELEAGTFPQRYEEG